VSPSEQILTALESTNTDPETLRQLRYALYAVRAEGFYAGIKERRPTPDSAGPTVEITYEGVKLEISYTYSPARKSYNREIPNDPPAIDLTGIWHQGEEISALLGEAREQEILALDEIMDLIYAAEEEEEAIE
jgi:hypothetical protein